VEGKKKRGEKTDLRARKRKTDFFLIPKGKTKDNPGIPGWDQINIHTRKRGDPRRRIEKTQPADLLLIPSPRGEKE